MTQLVKKFNLLKKNIKTEYRLQFPKLKQVSDQILSEYIDESRSRIANYFRYRKEIQEKVYNKMRTVDLDKLVMFILKRKCI